jgi:ADP-ribose pyrophosphatase
MFDWIGVQTECRDVRGAAHGEELRCLVNRERIRDTATGQVVTRVIIRHPGICVMVPFLTDAGIVLLRQYRYPLDDELWELPAGTLRGREADGRAIPVETPEACAARELREECGYEAARWEKVAECYAMPGGSDEMMHVFFARGLTRTDLAPDEGEVIREVRAFDVAELERMIGRGGIRDAKTLVGLFYALGRRAGGVRLT